MKPVPDPRRFGVAELGENGWVKRLIEKPQEMENNLAVVGFYYFKEAGDLLSAIEEQIARNLQLKGEYFLADAINIMLERGLRMRIQEVDIWLDAGTAETLLETNRYLLEHGRITAHETPAVRRRGDLPAGVHPPHGAGAWLDHRAECLAGGGLPASSTASSATRSWKTKRRPPT